MKNYYVVQEQGHNQVKLARIGVTCVDSTTEPTISLTPSGQHFQIQLFSLDDKSSLVPDSIVDVYNVETQDDVIEHIFNFGESEFASSLRNYLKEQQVKGNVAVTDDTGIQKILVSNFSVDQPPFPNYNSFPEQDPAASRIQSGTLKVYHPGQHPGQEELSGRFTLNFEEADKSGMQPFTLSGNLQESKPRDSDSGLGFGSTKRPDSLTNDGLGLGQDSTYLDTKRSAEYEINPRSFSIYSYDHLKNNQEISKYLRSLGVSTSEYLKQELGVESEGSWVGLMGFMRLLESDSPIIHRDTSNLIFEALSPNEESSPAIQIPLGRFGENGRFVAPLWFFPSQDELEELSEKKRQAEIQKVVLRRLLVLLALAQGKTPEQFIANSQLGLARLIVASVGIVSVLASGSMFTAYFAFGALSATIALGPLGSPALGVALGVGSGVIAVLCLLAFSVIRELQKSHAMGQVKKYFSIQQPSEEESSCSGSESRSIGSSENQGNSCFSFVSGLFRSTTTPDHSSTGSLGGGNGSQVIDIEVPEQPPQPPAPDADAAPPSLGLLSGGPHNSIFDSGSKPVDELQTEYRGSPTCSSIIV